MKFPWLEEVLDIALAAGDITLKYHPVRGSQQSKRGEHALEVETKADDSPVTQADLQANQIIVEGLARVTPDIPVVSEESPGSEKYLTTNGRFWLVDPLDGTRGFVQGDDAWTVNLALVENGKSILGVVYAPLDHRLYWGSPETGSFVRMDGQTKRLQVSDVPVSKEEPLRVLASRAHLGPRTQAFIKRLGHTEMVRWGSSVKLCMIALGEGDLYPRLGTTSQWDIAAAQAVLEGAGGQVLDLKGQPLRYGQAETDNPHFVASRLGYGAWKGALA